MTYRTQDRRPTSTFRSLEGLTDIRANGRVLNLGAIARDFVRAGIAAPEIFASAALGQSIILKHNIRDNERQLFGHRHPIATKVVLPIDPERLALGATTFMLGERQADLILKDKLGLGRQSEEPRVQRDLKILGILDSLATLDSFVLRERLALEGVSLPEAFVMLQVKGDRDLCEYMRAALIKAQPATEGAAGGGVDQQMLGLLLSEITSGSNESKAAPLRELLAVPSESWSRAIDACRAALFYEFKSRQFAPRWQQFMNSLQYTKLHGFSEHAPAEVALKLRSELLDRVLRSKSELDNLLDAFDKAFRGQFLAQGSPEAFGEYLLSLNVGLYNFGTAYGALEQFVGYWEYWFISRSAKTVPADLFVAICQDLLDAVDAQGVGQ
jgi:hypothetical protein